MTVVTTMTQARIQRALATLGAVEAEPGVWLAELTDGTVVELRPPAASWSTCSRCGDLVALTPDQVACPDCERTAP